MKVVICIMECIHAYIKTMYKNCKLYFITTFSPTMANANAEEEVDTRIYKIQRLTNISLFCSVCNSEMTQWAHEDQKAVKMLKHQEKHRKTQPSMLTKLGRKKASIEHDLMLYADRRKQQAEQAKFRHLSKIAEDIRCWGSIPAIPRYEKAYQPSQEWGDLNEKDPADNNNSPCINT